MHVSRFQDLRGNFPNNSLNHYVSFIKHLSPSFPFTYNNTMMASCINDFKFSIAMIFACRYLMTDLLREGYFLVVLLEFLMSLIPKWNYNL